MFKISDSAIKLNFVLNGITYASDEALSEMEKSELRERLRVTSLFLYDASTKEVIDKNLITLLMVMQIAKLIEDDEIEIKVYEYLLQVSKSKEQTDLIEQMFKSNIIAFNLIDDETLEHLSQFLVSMGVTNIKEVYQELDLLQVDVFNKPLHLH